MSASNARAGARRRYVQRAGVTRRCCPVTLREQPENRLELLALLMRNGERARRRRRNRAARAARKRNRRS